MDIKDLLNVNKQFSKVAATIKALPKNITSGAKKIAPSLPKVKSSLETMIPKANAATLSPEKRAAMEAVLKEKGVSLPPPLDPEKKAAMEAALKEKGISLPPKPRPLSEVMAEQKGFNEEAIQKASQEDTGLYNTMDQARDFKPWQDVLGGDLQSAGQTVVNAGAAVLGGTKDFVFDGQKRDAMVGGAWKAGGDIANAVGGAVTAPFNDPSVLYKAPIDAVAGVYSKAPDLGFNLLSAGADLGNQINKMNPLVPEEVKQASAQQASDVRKRLKETKESTKELRKDISRGFGANPDSAAAKAGEFTVDLLNTLLVSKGLGTATKGATLANMDAVIPKIMKGSKGNFGSRIIKNTETTGPVAAFTRQFLNKASAAIPNTGKLFKDSAITTGAATVANNGELPSAGTIILNAGFDKLLNKTGQKLVKDARYKYINKASIFQATKESEQRFNSVVDRMMKKGLSAKNKEEFKGLMGAEYKESNKVFQDYLTKNPIPVTSKVEDFIKTKTGDLDNYSPAKAKAIEKRLQEELKGRPLETLKDVDSLVQYANKELAPYLSGSRQIATDSATDVQMYELLRDWGKEQLKQGLPKNVYNQRYRAEVAKRALDSYESIQKALSDQISGQNINVSQNSKEAKKSFKQMVKRKESFGKGTTSAVLKRDLGEKLQGPFVKTLARKPLAALQAMFSNQQVDNKDNK